MRLSWNFAFDSWFGCVTLKLFLFEKWWSFHIRHFKCFTYLLMLHDRGVHSFLWVWVWGSSSQRIPLSALERNPHKGLAREISYETGRRRGKARPTEKRSDCQEKATVRERRLLSKVLGPVDPEARSASAKGWVSAPGSCVENFVQVHARDRHRSTECEKSVKNFSHLTPRANPNISSILSCLCGVLCVCKAMGNTSGRRWEKPLDDWMAMSWFKELEYWRMASGHIVTGMSIEFVSYSYSIFIAYISIDKWRPVVTCGFLCYFCVDSGVSLLWQFCDRKILLQKRSIP